jgi:CMP-N-acetylneuraminic acid synthetase
MYQNKKILALIPARGGSKGIKDKNIIDLCGKPLIAYTIEAALGSNYIDGVVVSTDSQKIADVAVSCGASVPFLRPAELAADTSKTIDGVIHALNTLKEQGRTYDVLILLQPTQPLRDTSDIDNAITEFFAKNYSSLVSVSPVCDAPVLIRSLGDNNRCQHLLDCTSTVRRQDMKKYYVVNGCIYINYVSDINAATSFNDNEYAFVMESSHSVDIDEYADLNMAEYYLKNLTI